jgi:hypothetical protein
MVIEPNLELRTRGSGVSENRCGQVTHCRKIVIDIVKKIKEDYQPDKTILFGYYTYKKTADNSALDLLSEKRANQCPILIEGLREQS